MTPADVRKGRRLLEVWERAKARGRPAAPGSEEIAEINAECDLDEWLRDHAAELLDAVEELERIKKGS